MQRAPVWLDRAATTEVVVASLEEAAAGGAELVAFAETFLPGYPWWVDVTNTSAWEDREQQAAYAWYLDQAVEPDGPELDRVVEAAGDLGVFIFLGMAERSPSGGSVYCSLAAIHPERGLVGVHRKLKPTFGERLVWADGDGAGLVAHEWKGVRVSGLNCWENWMPLARAALYAQGTQVHVAVWPGATRLTEQITPFIAREGRVFAVSVGAINRPEHVPSDFPLHRQLSAAASHVYDGGTMVAGPSGKVLAGPIRDEERLVFFDIDLGQVPRQRQNFDPTGHYSRPDVLRLEVDRRRHQVGLGPPGG